MRFFKRNKIEWEDGICNGKPARRNIKAGNVQFRLWKIGDQKHIDGIGHTSDKWIDFDSSWWNEFRPIHDKQ